MNDFINVFKKSCYCLFFSFLKNAFKKQMSRLQEMIVVLLKCFHLLKIHAILQFVVFNNPEFGLSKVV